MMSKPSVVQLVGAIRENLSGAIAPAVANPGAQKLLLMIDHLLQTIGVRAEHEIDWMVTYADDVANLAERMVAADTAPASVTETLHRYHKQRSTSLATSAVTANYALAGDVLSAILEATISDEGDVGVSARGLLARDVAYGVDIVGEFELIPP